MCILFTSMCSLQCDCCELGYPGQLLPSMPDLSVAYKLLLESGQQVNIYDWLVAFSSIVGIKNDDDKDDDGNVPQDIQYDLFTSIHMFLISQSLQKAQISPFDFHSSTGLDLLVLVLSYNSSVSPRHQSERPTTLQRPLGNPWWLI